MAYGSPMAEGGTEEGMDATSEMGVIHIPSDMLPEGMASTCKPGDILEFKVKGPADADGDIPVEYNHGDSKDMGEDKSWEDDLRKSVSPRTPTEETDQPEM